MVNKIIETERLRLTPWTSNDEDVRGCYEMAKNPNVGPNAGWKPHANLEESKMIIETLFMPSEVWAIRDKKTNKIMGSIGLDPDKRRESVNSKEMGYWLGEEFWGKGYMTEAAKAVIDFGFKEYDLVLISICTGPNNKRSQSVIDKCGFKFEGIQRKGYHIFTGEDRDNRVYSLLREEWEEKKKENI